MFGFNKKNNNEVDEYHNLEKLRKVYMERNKPYFDWIETDDYKLLNHLQTLISKTYETVNIKVDLIGIRLDRSFTRVDYVEDFNVFFKPEVFSKLREWCKDYETLCEAESKATGIEYK